MWNDHVKTMWNVSSFLHHQMLWNRCEIVWNFKFTSYARSKLTNELAIQFKTNFIWSHWDRVVFVSNISRNRRITCLTDSLTFHVNFFCYLDLFTLPTLNNIWINRLLQSDKVNWSQWYLERLDNILQHCSSSKWLYVVSGANYESINVFTVNKLFTWNLCHFHICFSV